MEVDVDIEPPDEPVATEPPDFYRFIGQLTIFALAVHGLLDLLSKLSH